jgi:hypothetical protein
MRRLLDSRGEPTFKAIDFFVESKVACVRGLHLPKLRAVGATASKKQEKRREILVAVVVCA